MGRDTLAYIAVYIFFKSIFSHFLYASMTVIINTTFVSQGDFNGVTPSYPA